MNGKRLIRALCAAAILAVGVPTARGQLDYKGMSLFGYGSNLGNPDLFESLYDMKTLGVDTVALNTWWKQDNKTANAVYEDLGGMSASRAQIENAIDLIHSLGMKVYLKPNLDPGDGVWRALIAPSNPAAWFASYGDYINAMADLAQQKGVEMFSVGTEMESMANKPSYLSHWTNVIGGVRSRYSGVVTYAANHGDAYDGAINYGNYEDVPFWNQLDYIGVDAYFPLTNKTNPTPAELQTAWNSRANAIANCRTSQGLTPQVLFTEVGYGAYDGSNMTPWGADSGIPDPGEQRDAYNALLTVMEQRSWWRGAFWWSWETQPHAGLQQPTGFTPQDREAMQTLATHYGGSVPPHAPQPPELIGSWEGSLQGYTATNGASIAISSSGTTAGSSSVAVTSPNSSFRWALGKTISGASGNEFLTWQDAASDLAHHTLSFDVTYLSSAIPQNQVTDVRMFVALNSPIGWSQVDNLAIVNGRSNQTLHVSIPMSQFSLTPNSTWYQVNFALAGNWGSNPATVFIDNLRIVDAAGPALGDFDGNGVVDGADLASWRYGFGLFRHGDADKDGKSDGDDLLAWQRQLGLPPSAVAANAPVPEPATLLLFIVAAAGIRRMGG